jgi:hypothetical protein
VIIQTASGSQYEIDAENKQVRQLRGLLTDRINRNGAGTWAPFDEAYVKLNKPAIFFWPATVPLLPESAGQKFEVSAVPMTYTSRVVAVDHGAA